MKEYSNSAFFTAINLLKQIRYFEEEYHARNQLFMAKERERYIGESDCIQLVLGPMKWQKHPFYLQT